MESPPTEFYLLNFIQPVGRDLSSSKLFLEAKINTMINSPKIFFTKCIYDMTSILIALN